MLAKSPGFAAVAILTLALGIGANTAIFSVADAFLVRPLALASLDRLAVVATGQKAPAAPADYLDWKNDNHSFEDLAASRQPDLNLTGTGEPQRVYGALVTSNFFQTLGVQPALGRSFAPEEDQPGHNAVAILSFGLWQSRFAGDPGILGKAIHLNGRAYTVAGVMGRDFNYPVPTDVWIPLVMTPQEKADRATLELRVVGRLRPGASIEQAQTELSTISQRLTAAYPATNKDRQAHVMPLGEYVEGTITRAYTFMLLVVVGIVLLVACANVANLQFARATARKAEISVRVALGASRWRIVKQLLTESVILSALGGALSLILASYCIWLLDSNMPPDVARQIPGWNQIQLDYRAFFFTLAIAIGSGILAGLAPAFESSRPDLAESLKETGRASGAGRRTNRLRNIFVVAQVAVALVLLVSAGLLVKGFRGLVHSGDAFAPASVLHLEVMLPSSRYPQESDRAAFFRKSLDSFRSMPGVESACAFTTIPLSNNGTIWDYFQIEGRSSPDRRHSPSSTLHSISPGYLNLMRIPLLEGRDISDADREDSQPVALVSQRLEQIYWPGESALGKHFRIGPPDSKNPWITIVGVTQDVLYDWTDNRPEPALYRPYTQAPLEGALFALRTSASPASFIQSARGRLAALDPELPAFEVKPLSDEIHESIVGIAYVGVMMGILGLIAAAIAAAGVYGVMAFAVAERTHEFGVRMTLGAQPGDVLRLILRRGVALLTAGLVIGLPAAIASARLLAGLIFGASATDLPTFAGVPLLLSAAIVIACYIPARRAMRVDPIVALRYE